jgi:phage major head subunit gpT-like protein
MILNASTLADVFTGLKTIFVEAVQSTETSQIERLMEVVPSQAGSEIYPVSTLLGDLEEVLDEVTMTNLGVWLQTVPNRTYARIVQVRRDDIADDNIGVYRPGVRQLARRAALYPLRLAAEVLLSGFTDLWVDGTTVFSTNHQWTGGPAWSNRTAAALDADAFDSAVSAIEQRVGSDGGPLGLKADLLVCGPTNRAAAEEILEVEYTTGGRSNRHYKKCDLLVLSRFGASPTWFVMDTDPLKPMVLQDREGPEFTAKEDPGDDDAFYRELYAYKGRRRCAAAIVAPWLVQASTGE